MHSFKDYCRYRREAINNDFLMGTNETFVATRGNITLMKSFPSLNKIYSLIIQEEQQRSFTRGPLFNSENIAIMATPSHMIATTAPHCNFKTTNSGHKERPLCTYCNRKGHP